MRTKVGKKVKARMAKRVSQFKLMFGILVPKTEEEADAYREFFYKGLLPAGMKLLEEYAKD